MAAMARKQTGQILRKGRHANESRDVDPVAPRRSAGLRRLSTEARRR